MSRLTDRLQEQSAKTGIKQVDIAAKLGITPQAVNNLFNGRAVSTAYWREIAEILEIDETEMRELMIEGGRDPERSTKFPLSREAQERMARAWKESKARASSSSTEIEPNAKILETQLPALKTSKMIPVLGEVVGGEDGEYIFNGSVLDYVACPPSLANVPGAYSVYVDGESMYPRYRPGETVYVHPTKPPRRGDDVVVQIHPKQEGMPPHGFIKELIGWSGNKLALHQYNPEKRIEFDREQVVSVHAIVFSGRYA